MFLRLPEEVLPPHPQEIENSTLLSHAPFNTDGGNILVACLTALFSVLYWTFCILFLCLSGELEEEA